MEGGQDNNFFACCNRLSDKLGRLANADCAELLSIPINDSMFRSQAAQSDSSVAAMFCETAFCAKSSLTACAKRSKQAALVRWMAILHGIHKQCPHLL
eukprot:6214656-Pleurochrysis_carterae.AAC.5